MATIANAFARPTLSFPARLQLAASRPLLAWTAALAVTLASSWTWLNTTLRMDPAFQPMGDFAAYYNAASDMNAKLDPYLRYNPNLPFSLSLGYIYPPFLARLLQPLAHLDRAQANLAAVLFLQACILVTVFLLARQLRLRSWPARLLLLDCFWLSSGLVANLQVGQVNPLLMLLAMAFISAYAAARRESFVYVAIASALKLTQAPILGLALVRRQWSALALAIATLASTVVIGGLPLTIEYFTRVFPKLTSTIPAGAQNTSLLADIERLLHPGSDSLTYDPSYPEAHLLFALLLAPIAFLTLRALLPLRDRLTEALLVLCAIPFATSYLGAAHIIPLYPAYILLAALALRQRAWGLAAISLPAIAIIADYPLFFTLVTALDYQVARAFFYEWGPGLAALFLWVVSLCLAQRQLRRQRAYS